MTIWIDIQVGSKREREKERLSVLLFESLSCTMVSKEGVATLLDYEYIRYVSKQTRMTRSILHENLHV